MADPKGKFRARLRRRRRVRRKVAGTPERPRLSVYRSNRHMHGQIIDDLSGRTLAAASTLQPTMRESIARGANRAAAEAVGAQLAEAAKAVGVTRVVFDRSGYLYHGRVKALAEGARKGGLTF